MKFRCLGGVVASLFPSVAVFGHEGHGHPEHQDGIYHYVINPSHAVPTVCVIAVSLITIWAIRIFLRAQSSDNR